VKKKKSYERREKRGEIGIMMIEMLEEIKKDFWKCSLAKDRFGKLL
jgi:hypothetical protein